LRHGEVVGSVLPAVELDMAILAETPMVYVRGPEKLKVLPKPRIDVGDITPNNIGIVKRLCSVLFPVTYSEKFFQNILLPECDDFCKLVFMNDIPVGLLTCRIEYTYDEIDSKIPNGAKLYIATLGILAPYRRQGLATRLLHHILEASVGGVAIPQPPNSNGTEKPSTPKKGEVVKKSANATTSLRPKVKFTSAYVHVQTSNEEGKAFWEKNEFTVKRTIDNYYTKIEPREAWVLSKDLTS